jgi:hypothetical protein
LASPIPCFLYSLTCGGFTETPHAPFQRCHERSWDTRGRPGLLPLHKHPVSTNCRYHLLMLFLCSASFWNRARNSRYTIIPDLDTSKRLKRSRQKATPCFNAIFEICPAVTRPRSKHEKRTAGSAWDENERLGHTWTGWTVGTAGGEFCRVKWDINFLLTFETAPLFCVYKLTFFIKGS